MRGVETVDKAPSYRQAFQKATLLDSGRWAFNEWKKLAANLRFVFATRTSKPSIPKYSASNRSRLYQVGCIFHNFRYGHRLTTKRFFRRNLLIQHERIWPIAAAGDASDGRIDNPCS
jgi:hypothetical protein